MFLTTAAAPRSTCVSSPRRAGAAGAGLFGGALGLGGAAAFGVVFGRWAAAFGAALSSRAVSLGGGRRRAGSPVRRLRAGRPACCGSPLSGLGVLRRFGGVVDQELVPTRIDRGGILAEFAIHLLDQPLVLSEW